MPNQPRRQTIVQATALDGGADSERIVMVAARSQSIGRAKEMDPLNDAELDDEMHGTEGQHPPVRDDMSPEAGLRHTPVNTSPRCFDTDGYSLRANGLPDGVWRLQPREVWAFAAVTCYNELGKEKVWNEMPISIIIDGRAMVSQSMLDSYPYETPDPYPCP